jgi:hypothetical protein
MNALGRVGLRLSSGGRRGLSRTAGENQAATRQKHESKIASFHQLLIRVPDMSRLAFPEMKPQRGWESEKENTSTQGRVRVSFFE